MGILTGVVSACVLVFIFRLIEKKVLGKLRIAEICFLFMIVFLSSIYNPLSHLWQWFALCLLFYAALDDLLTLSFRVELPLASFLILLFDQWDKEQMIWSIVLFVLIFVFSKVTKGAVIADGDAFIALPLMYFTTTHHVFAAMYLSCILGGILFTVIEVFLSEKKYPFIPLMIVGTVIIVSKWHIDLLFVIGTVFVCICYVVLLWHRRRFQN